MPSPVSFIDFVRKNLNSDVRSLMLQAQRYPDVDMRKAVVQISAWQMAQKKLPLWAATEGIIFPEHLSMEQCSSQQTATYKGEILVRWMQQSDWCPSSEPLNITDLTGGFGVDATCLALAAGKSQKAHLTFVERNEELCLLAQNNLPLLGVEHSDVICADSEEILNKLTTHQHLIYIDPARRDEHGGKTVAISDCTPDVIQFNDLLLDKADVVMLKLSPMLDIVEAERQLKGIREIHIVSVNGECKEILFILQKAPKTSDGFDQNEAKMVCVNLLANLPAQTFVFSHSIERNATCHYTSELKQYLYEPNASVMKAMAFKSVAQLFHVEKLHPSSQLYTSDTLIPDFPGRIFEITASSHFNKKELKNLLKDIQKANLTVRNFPLSVAELRKRLKLSEGGSDYLFATTLADDSHVLILCKKTLS
ncbi:MAG: SAM-dependent methyltransferase [Bacteroidaceae bacterium]|nr:SAM-dependent methyltransferase [Bacteroidaceae bacterium]